MHGVKNQAWVKETFKVQDRPMDYNISEYKKFINTVSESSLPLTLKNYHLLILESYQRRLSTII